MKCCRHRRRSRCHCYRLKSKYSIHAHIRTNGFSYGTAHGSNKKKIGIPFGRIRASYTFPQKLFTFYILWLLLFQWWDAVVYLIKKKKKNKRINSNEHWDEKLCLSLKTTFNSIIYRLHSIAHADTSVAHEYPTFKSILLERNFFHSLFGEILSKSHLTCISRRFICVSVSR